MIYTWDKGLETGNTKIDTQHKQLIETLNKLITAHEESHGPALLGQTLQFMTAYVVQHFNDEEALQIEYKYPEYEFHRGLHNDFKFVVKDLTSQMDEQGFTTALVEKTIKVMADWLITHIKGDDLKLAQYIKKIEDQRKNSKNI